jgi:hypothetical protein
MDLTRNHYILVVKEVVVMEAKEEVLLTSMWLDIYI